MLFRAESGGPGSYRSFATEGAGETFRDDFNAELVRRRAEGRTVGTAVEAYQRHVEGAGHRQATETIRRVRLFFADALDTPLADLTERQAARLYDELTTRHATRWVGSGEDRRLVDLGRPLSVASHRGMLTDARTFLSWCVGQRWLDANPLDKVKGKGRKSRGQKQLRIDEARAWYAKALDLARTQAGPVASLCGLLLGMRASEIVTRQVRDLDDEGRVLWIDDVGDFRVKTSQSRRSVEVPDVLRPHLLALARGRDREALLFGGVPGRYARRRGPKSTSDSTPHRRGWVLFWTKRIAEEAGVPLVSAHSLRGLSGTLALRQGATGELVAAALGHSEEVLLGHYAQPGTAAAAARRRGLEVLDGRGFQNGFQDGSHKDEDAG